MPALTYRSKVDWWIGLIVVSVPVVAVASAVALLLSGDAVGATVGWLTLAGVALLYWAIVWPVRYVLDSDALVVRFGIVRARVPYRSIRSVAPSRSVIAAPSLSMDRLAIDRGAGLPVLISPADRSGFLADLASRTPHLRREGDRLVPG